MTDGDATALLKAERYLLFHELRAEPAYNAVTLRVDGAEPSAREEPAGTGNARVDRILGPVRVIDSGPGCLRYAVTFDRCVAYLWRDESFAIPETDEDFSTMLRHYPRSAFQEFVAETTFAAQVTDAPLAHYAVVTLDAILDVICPDPPTVTAEMLDPDDPGTLPDRPPARR